MCSLLLINVSSDSVGVLWKSGCFHFLMKRKYDISYSDLLPMRFCFKLLLEGCCSSLLRREIYNTGIYASRTMLGWPWKNRCTARIVSDKCRRRNRELGSIGNAYNLPGCISFWRRRGLVLRKTNLSFLWMHVYMPCCISCPEGSASQYLTAFIQRVSNSTVLLTVLQHMLLICPSATLLWGAAWLSCTPKNGEGAFCSWASAQVLKKNIAFHSLIVYSFRESL